MAAGLHLSGEDAAQAIIEFCRKRVAALLKGARGLRSIADIERVICDKLNLVIHEIWNDEELDQFDSVTEAEEGAPLSMRIPLEEQRFELLPVSFGDAKQTLLLAEYRFHRHLVVRAVNPAKDLVVVSVKPVSVFVPRRTTSAIVRVITDKLPSHTRGLNRVLW